MKGMTYLNIDFRLCEDHNVSFNAAAIFSVMKSLMSLSYAWTIPVGDKQYYVIHNEYILQNIPYCNIKSRTLSSVLKELRDSGLIDSNGNNMQPAYRFTEKSDKYITTVKANGGEVPNVNTRSKPLFSLSKLTGVTELKPEYMKLLRQHAGIMCKNKGVPFSEFENFINHHGAKGSKFKNYIMAFGTWCAKYKKYNTNDGESDGRGLYK